MGRQKRQCQRFEVPEETVPEIGCGQVADQGAGNTAGTANGRDGVQHGRIAQSSNHDHHNKY